MFEILKEQRTECAFCRVLTIPEPDRIPLVCIPDGLTARLPMRICDDCAEDVTLRDLLTPELFAGIMLVVFTEQGFTGLGTNPETWYLQYAREVRLTALDN